MDDKVRQGMQRVSRIPTPHCGPSAECISYVGVSVADSIGCGVDSSTADKGTVTMTKVP